MKNKTLIIITIIAVVLFISIVIFNILKKRKNKAYANQIKDLDKQKNLIDSTPVLSLLAKVETIIKNDKMEEKYKAWQKRYEYVKSVKIPSINDMITDLDIFLDKKDYIGYQTKVAKIELELYKAKEAMDTLVYEIEEINSSEEKYRSIITKLKTKYRELESKFEIHKKEYEDISEVIALQFENIEKRFQDFEVSMEKNDYNEVVHIVKAIDTMVDHMSLVIGEVPDLILLAKKLIPKRIEQISKSYEEMIKEDYPLDHLKIPYNLEESLKNVNKIIDRIKVLNLEDCMFELKTMLEYLDSLFKEFEREKQSRKMYDEESLSFNKKLKNINGIVNDIYNQIDDIKNMYDLKDDDIKIIDHVKEKLNILNKDYKKAVKKLEKKETWYSSMLRELKGFSYNLKKIDEELDNSLKTLGNMYEDEVRAREQLDEIQKFLNESKNKIRSYKLPIISNNYFVELAEANDAIGEIIKELEKKPISIKVLNTRVDTARDLVLKVYNTTNEMVNTAMLVEESIIYGNRYRSENTSVDKGLNNAERLFYKGNYKEALDSSFKVIDLVDPNFKNNLLNAYNIIK